LGKKKKEGATTLPERRESPSIEGAAHSTLDRAEAVEASQLGVREVAG